jgi:hypothetical protein
MYTYIANAVTSNYLGKKKVVIFTVGCSNLCHAGCVWRTNWFCAAYGGSFRSPKYALTLYSTLKQQAANFDEKLWESSN